MPSYRKPSYAIQPVTNGCSAHRRVIKTWGRAKDHPCVECNNPAYDWAYDGTDPSERYSQRSTGHWVLFSSWPEFYMPMCRSCHCARDRAIAARELREYREWKFRTGGTLADA